MLLTDVLKKVGHASGIEYVLQEFVPFEPAEPESNTQASDAAASAKTDEKKDTTAEQPTDH